MNQFRIYPDNRDVFCDVFVWPTYRQMYRATKGVKSDYGALCEGWKLDAENKCLADLHFTKQHFGSGVVAHECCHATHWYFKSRKRLRLPLKARLGDGHGLIDAGPGCVSPVEETFCWVLENMVLQFWHNFRNGHQYRPRKRPPFNPIVI